MKRTFIILMFPYLLVAYCNGQNIVHHGVDSSRLTYNHSSDTIKRKFSIYLNIGSSLPFSSDYSSVEGSGYANNIAGAAMAGGRAEVTGVYMISHIVGVAARLALDVNPSDNGNYFLQQYLTGFYFTMGKGNSYLLYFNFLGGLAVTNGYPIYQSDGLAMVHTTIPGIGYGTSYGFGLQFMPQKLISFNLSLSYLGSELFYYNSKVTYYANGYIDSSNSTTMVMGVSILQPNIGMVIHL